MSNKKLKKDFKVVSLTIYQRKEDGNPHYYTLLNGINYSSSESVEIEEDYLGKEFIEKLDYFSRDRYIDKCHLKYQYGHNGMKITDKCEKGFGCFYRSEGKSVPEENTEFLISDVAFKIAKNGNDYDLGKAIINESQDQFSDHETQGSDYTEPESEARMTSKQNDIEPKELEYETLKTLKTNTKYFIGRYGKNKTLEDNIISLDDDIGVSRRHCELYYETKPEQEKSGWVIENTSSLNGVFIKIDKKKMVSWNQTVRIGADTFIYFTKEKIEVTV